MDSMEKMIELSNKKNLVYTEIKDEQKLISPYNY